LLGENGVLQIETPNFRYHAELCLNGDEEKAIYYAFGGQEDEWDVHKTGFTKNILERELQSAGFKDIEIINGTSLVARATK
jgi:hypothetical protein